MKYAYENLSPTQFEELVVVICQFLLGAATQGFATGPDGGRDAKFVGTAALLPSEAAPWTGTVIVQAKHTNASNATFSDTDFYSEKNASTVLGKELGRTKKLRTAKALDHYLLFSNRKLTGVAEPKLREVISKQCSLPAESVMLCGIEQLELWLKRFPDAVRMARIDPIDSPLIVSPDDLAEVVEHLAADLKKLPSLPDLPVDRVLYERKNELNNMTKEFALQQRKLYLRDTAQIQGFLAAPENATLLSRYQLAVEEFQLGVFAKRKDHQTFDEIIDYLAKLLLDRDPVLAKNKRLTRTMLFYMYWNCDLGVREEDAAP